MPVCTLVEREVDNGLALCTQQLLGNSDKIMSPAYPMTSSTHCTPRPHSIFIINDICQQQFTFKPHNNIIGLSIFSVGDS